PGPWRGSSLRQARVSVRRPVSMEKTALRAVGSFRIGSLDTVARSFGSSRSRHRERRMEGRKSEPGRGLFSLPPDTVAGVLEGHADRGEGVADSVRGREVRSLPRSPTLLHDEAQQPGDLLAG